MRLIPLTFICCCLALMKLNAPAVFAESPAEKSPAKQEHPAGSKFAKPTPLVDFAEEFVVSMRELNPKLSAAEQKQAAVELGKRFNVLLKPQSWTVPCTINNIRKADKPGSYIIEYDPPSELTGVPFHWRFRALYTMPLTAAEAENYAPGDQIVFTGKPEYQTKQEANFFFSIAHEKTWDRAGFVSLNKLEVKLKKVEQEKD